MSRRRDCVRVVVTASLAWASVLNGCATAVDTLEPLEETAGDGGSTSMPDGGKTSSAGKTSAGGTKSSGGSSSASGSSSGGTISAFGGSAAMGGKSAGGSGGNASAGTAGTSAGGKAAGGSGGNASGGGGAGGKASGGSSGSANGGNAGTGGGGGMPLACLKSWKGDKCDTCSSQTQSDKLACVDILDCYAANNCGPATCGGNTDKCGANNIGKGTAGYPIAQTVYDCLCK